MKAGYLLERLYDAVASMRSHQKMFFKNRKDYDLQMSKKFERDVDNILFNIKQLKDSNQIEP